MKVFPVVIPVSLNVNLPGDASAWELYTNHDPAILTQAVCEINLAVMSALQHIAERKSDGGLHPDVEEVWEKFVKPVLEKHCKLGARDTEPRVISKTILYNFAKRIGINVDVNQAVYPW